MSWVQRCSIQPPPWLPSNNLALGTVAQAACSLGCPTPSLGIPRDAARGAGAWATKQPPEYPLCTCFSLSAGEPSLHDTARVPELPQPTEKPVTNRQKERTCVCRGRRGVPFACACICLHSHDPECQLGWRSLSIIPVTGAASSPPDTGPEATAMTFSPNMFLGAPFLVPVEHGGRILAGILVSASPDSSSSLIFSDSWKATFFYSRLKCGVPEVARVLLV